ncbi:hypothetical protein O3597_06735 [Verrucosispora sp. WMMA2044]|uniref:hypothetical protein n=1 Tax=Verrucosispora sp. WMMA2044 TaxID=3016419 RepID=UPI00248BDBA4|nr:hypothetical protein [Verrucosispora sp. WMMA2044]WBB50153.1 hypothetical protein O3597_06735 [Verrucosispora sp. WMMA2044]
MTGFPAVELPGTRSPADPARLIEAIDGWTGAAALRTLVSTFGGAMPKGKLGDRLDWLDSFSRVWDSRDGGERHESRQIDYDRSIRDLVDRAAMSLGLRGRHRPRHIHYRHVLVAGGGVRTCVARSAFAVTLITGGLEADQVAGLGSLRPVTDQERGHARSLGLPCIEIEFDGMDAGLRRALRLDRPVVDDLVPGAGSGGWRKRTYQTGCRLVHVLAAPSSEPAIRRANTADTLRFWAEQVGRPGPEDQVLLVTTDLHVPFQHCDAVRTLSLRYGCGVDTVGLEPQALADPQLRHAYPTSAVLQELRSAVRSMRALYEALPAVSLMASRNASDRC